MCKRIKKMIEYTVRVYANGDKLCLRNDKLHREDGPAIEYANGAKSWFFNGNPHREDGPAVEWADGTKSWYLNGKLLTEQEHKKATNKTTAADRIEELEAKLAKAVAVAEKSIGWLRLYGADVHKESTTLAELKGQDND